MFANYILVPLPSPRHLPPQRPCHLHRPVRHPPLQRLCHCEIVKFTGMRRVNVGAIGENGTPAERVRRVREWEMYREWCIQQCDERWQRIAGLKN